MGRKQDDWPRALLRWCARHQNAIQNGSDLVFPPCTIVKIGAAAIVVGCMFMIILMLAVPGDRDTPALVKPAIIVVCGAAIVAILLSVPGKVIVNPQGIRQVRWWGGVQEITWSDLTEVMHSSETKETLVYGRIGGEIAFSPYLAGQARFDKEVKAWGRRSEIPEDL